MGRIRLMIKALTKIILSLSLLTLLFSVFPAQARDADQITDWYIKDFQSEIVLNNDSTLIVTEKITADCGNLPDKHGIFRIVPTFYQKSASDMVNTPVDLVSITDFEGKPHKYTTIKDSGSVTWKIGDANKTVTGENYYKITYKVHNTVRFDNTEFDELYWNLNGNFWELAIDNFSAVLTFPSGIVDDNSEINLYSGNFGTKDAGLATAGWENNSLLVNSTRILDPGEGITLSITFPKNIVTKEPVSLAAIINYVLIGLLPLLALILAFLLWRKHGRDPKLGKTEMVQYEPPAKLGPMETGTILSNGYFRNNYLSAAIVKLAVDKVIRIEEIPKKGILGQKDFKLTVLDKGDRLSPPERVLFDKLFGGNSELLLSSLKNKFYNDIPAISGAITHSLVEKNYFVKSGFAYQTGFIIAATLLIGLGVAIIISGRLAGLGIILSSLIILLFSFLMRRRTPEGAEILWQIEGFKLFMTKAEKYRQRFYEKEGMFDRYLPYAMVFGITGIWINNMKHIYGEEYFNTYHPYWYAGYAFAHFDAGSFEKSLNSMTTSMASTMASNPSSSGSGGGGFSGGGGGGGGGGGW